MEKSKLDDHTELLEIQLLEKAGSGYQYLHIDEILNEIGQIGRFQKFIMAAFSFIFLLPAYQSLITIFAADSPSWECVANSTECNKGGERWDDKRCSMNSSSWRFTRPQHYSIVTEFHLVCNDATLAYLATSAIFMGQIVGNICLGMLSDRYGRKMVMFPSIFGLIVTSFASSFSPNVYMFIAVRFFVGIFYGGVLLTNMIMSVELVGPKYRALAGIVIWNSWSVGLFSMTLFSWLLGNWRTLSICLSAPFIVTLLLYLIIPESVRWLRSQGHADEALEILKKVASRNKKQLDDNVRVSPIREDELSTASYKDLFATKALCKKTAAFSLLWFTNELIYLVLALASGDFTGNLYLDFMVVTAIDTPANLFSIFLINKLGRKRGVLVSYIITCSVLLAYAILQALKIKKSALRLVLVVIAKGFGLIGWCGVEIWSIESYPTNVRSQAVAFLYMTAVLASIASPWVAKWFKSFYEPLPFFIMGGFCTLSVVVSWVCLKETKGVELSDVEKKDHVNLEEIHEKC